MRKKRKNTRLGHEQIFFSKTLLMNIHRTHHIHNIAVRRKSAWKLFLENSPVQPLPLHMKCFKHLICAPDWYANSSCWLPGSICFSVFFHHSFYCPIFLVLGWGHSMQSNAAAPLLSALPCHLHQWLVCHCVSMKRASNVAGWYGDNGSIWVWCAVLWQVLLAKLLVESQISQGKMANFLQGNTDKI